MTNPSLQNEMESFENNPEYGYDGQISNILSTEYAHLGDTVYLDHAGATAYPISLIYEHYKDLTSTLLSNPHSRSPSSTSTALRISAIRQKILTMFSADSESFEVVFVANATAGIKLIVEGFSGHPKGFKYVYLRDVHTSLVGAKEIAQKNKCLSEEDVSTWLNSPPKIPIWQGPWKKGERDPTKFSNDRPGLFAYPAQSNFNGRRFPLDWVRQLREKRPGWYSLLDAASYLTTTPLDFSNANTAPDFTVMSFYKMFGYPDLGAIIVRKEAKNMLLQRRYFGGGTQAALSVDGFHAPHNEIAEALEDGTLPFHTIMALDAAFDTFDRLYGSHRKIARHAAQLTKLMHTLLSSLRHGNGKPVCQMFSRPDHGPIISFNLVTANGSQVGFAVFERHASSHKFAVRAGGMCNPGAVQQYLNIQKWEMERNYFEKGRVCGNDVDVIEGKNTGVVRVSFGACSTVEDVYPFVDFLQEFYVEK